MVCYQALSIGVQGAELCHRLIGCRHRTDQLEVLRLSLKQRTKFFYQVTVILPGNVYHLIGNMLEGGTQVWAGRSAMLAILDQQHKKRLVVPSTRTRFLQPQVIKRG